MDEWSTEYILTYTPRWGCVVQHRREAYLDQPLLAGRVHLSAPHIYGTGG